MLKRICLFHHLRWAVAGLVLFCSSQLYAQLSIPHVYEESVFEEGMQLYEDEVYGYAKERFAEFLAIPESERSPAWKSKQLNARLYRALSSLWLEDAAAEHELKQLIHKYKPDPIVFEAAMEVGNAYYNKKKYKEAISYYELIDFSQVKTELLAEAAFKNGYCHFVRKDFDLAQTYLSQSAGHRTVYYYPSNYYLGMIAFFDEDYDKAADYFEKVSPSKKYKSFVPYYLAQIYFSEGKYREVVDYGENQLNAIEVEKEAEIKNLIGRSYYELGEEGKALRYLREYRALQSDDLTASDHYQIGYLAYKEGAYDEAIEHLKQIASLKNETGVQANYYLAHTWLKKDQKEDARSAFANVRRMTEDRKLKDEATYNYGLLSAGLKRDREAVNALMEIGPSSDYYTISQEALAKLFLNTSDYDNAIEILDDLDKSNPVLKEAYQKVTYYKGKQLYRDNKSSEALTFLDKSLQYAIDPNIHAETQFAKGVIYHEQGLYESSINSLNSYQTLRQGTDTYNRFMAPYLNGYNYLKQRKYAEARSHFATAVSTIDEASEVSDYISTQIRSDALVRLADCEFHFNKYEEAHAHYKRAYKMQGSNYVYAYFQSAIIFGLKNDPIQKIVILEDIPERYPKNALADDALLEASRTYLKLGKYDQAATPLLDLIKDYDDSENITQAYMTLGLISYNKGSIDEAVKFYQKVFDFNPDERERQDAFRALQEIYINDLKDPDAYVAFIENVSGSKIENAVRDSLNYKTAYSSYVNAEYTDALKNLTSYITKYPHGLYHIEAHYFRAECAALAEDYSNAYRDYSYVVDQGNSQYYEKALYKAALIAYNELKNFEQAYEYYAQLADRNTDEKTKADALTGAMRSAYRLDRANQTIKYSDKVLAFNTSTKSQLSEADYYAANIRYRQKRYDDALRHLNRISGQSQDEMAAESRYLVASIYYEKEEFDIAEEMCRLAIKDNSNYPYWVAKSIILLSDVLVAREDTFNAKAALEAVIENYSEDRDLLNQAQSKLNSIEELEARQNKLLEESNGELLELEQNDNEE